MNLSTAEASEYLANLGVRLTRASLHQYRYLHRGPRYVRIGGRVYYPVAELDAYAAKVTSPLIDPEARALSPTAITTEATSA